MRLDQVKLLFAAQLIALVASQDKTCNLQQYCKGHDGPNQGKCDNPSEVTVADFPEGGFAPAPITDPTGIASFANSCPFLDPATPLCCNSDTAQIMEYNYRSLDAVFATDCPVCAVNLKTMWCEYACNPTKARFIKNLGLRASDGYRLVGFTIDSDYACGVFTSCSKVSYIAQAGISSSVSFLDFLGVNGQDYSLSVITFTLSKDDPDHSLMPLTPNDPYPCDYQVPVVDGKGTLNSYTDVNNSTCSYCDAACQKPAVNDDIAFFDGMNGALVGYSWLGFVLFTIIFQLLMYFVCNAGKRAELKNQQDMDDSDQNSATERTSRQQSGYKGAGRPMNVNHTASQEITERGDDKLIEN